MIGKQCCFCGKIIREHTANEYSPKKTGGSGKHEERVIGTHYILTYCNDECRKKHSQSKSKKRNELKKIIPELKRRDGGACVYCNSQEKLEVHHIIPIFNGGTNDIKNLVLLCHDCHMVISGKSITKLKKWRNKKDGSYSLRPTLNPEWEKRRKSIESRLKTF